MGYIDSFTKKGKKKKSCGNMGDGRCAAQGITAGPCFAVAVLGDLWDSGDPQEPSLRE